MRLAVLVLLCACGRLGFDATAGDGSVDGSVIVGLCDVRSVTTLDLAGNAPLKLRAVALDTEYAVAIATTGSNVYVARVPRDLSTAELHLPLPNSYTLGGIARIGPRVFVQAHNGGTGYLKLLDSTWDSYTTVDGADPLDIDPPIASTNADTALQAAVIAGMMKVRGLGSDGAYNSVLGNYVVSGATSGSIAAVSGGARVAVDRGDGTCETYLVTNAGNTTKNHVRPACTLPTVATLDTQRGVLAYRSGQMQVIYMVPDEPMAVGAQLILGGASDVRVATVGNELWLAYQLSDVVKLRKVDETLAGPPPSAVAIDGPFDLLGNTVFWLSGSTLRVARACSR